MSHGPRHPRLRAASGTVLTIIALPEWVFETSRTWLAQVRRIVTRFGVRVILDLNMVNATPQIAVRWARAARAALPTGSVIGFEISNEADISHTAWQELTGGAIAARAFPRR